MGEKGRDGWTGLIVIEIESRVGGWRLPGTSVE